MPRLRCVAFLLPITSLVYFCVVRRHFIAHLSHFVARGKGYYELQSTAYAYGILLISQCLSTIVD
jgi:hypothetical protein